MQKAQSFKKRQIRRERGRERVKEVTNRHGPGAVDLLNGLDSLGVLLELDEGTS